MKNTAVPSQVFITGVSSGIGLGLTREYLRQGWTVYGVSRHAPELGKNERFKFVPCDLSRDREIAPALKRLLAKVDHLDLVILNAGQLGDFGDLKDQPLSEMQRVMQINLWANKVLLDELFALPLQISQVVAISSGASIQGHRGWGGYAISKAALNMLISLSATEHPQTHFCAFAPGLVDTAMQDQLCSLPADPKYPALGMLRSKRGTAAMPDGDEIAPRLVELFQRLPVLVSSGSFADIRQPPLADNLEITGASG
ncbi:SDR family NAD(P)-dependent oxidoreductase [Planctomicrobium sp. SH661]|uniref:SDR family NAD(P)-dependent oxidoreductase n=1 Tax=Planctomicrobium sp. SH661 TaxID=3448124 RepID=UPI003F5CA57C